MQPAIYILCNRHRNVLYTGVTSNLTKRIYEHKKKLIPGFTLKYNVDQLVYYELFEMMSDAIYREKMIKKSLE
ncbi:MAG: hypothetical protein A3F16_01475 [Deltaproteobacteria bacterium RIFCSPHIGHO2_12_FULL_43_9]|nr:MAG: hypothetical protein A3F16_01475 [Deltaproteobacteria bacterium RIFCSPHIGHO2_12_FULL_43_9]